MSRQKDSPGKPFNNIQKPNLENLRYHNNNLQRLLSFCTGSNVLAHDSPPVALSAEKFERISLHARNLYMALLDCFRCSCPFPHRAGLRLCEVSPGAINVGEQFELFVSLDETNVNQKMKKIEESEDLSARYSLLRLLLIIRTKNSVIHLNNPGHQLLVRAACSGRDLPPLAHQENTKNSHFHSSSYHTLTVKTTSRMRGSLMTFVHSLRILVTC